jgi:uncharacterized protein (TIGR02284 family)
MASENSKVLAILNDLVATCKDGENGYRSAKEDVDDKELTDLFGSYVEQRSRFATQLLEKIHGLDSAAERPGSTLARIHRGWMNMKASLTSRDAGAVVAECARGEAAALKDYEKALQHALPPEVKTLLHQQYDQLKAAHDRVKALEHLRTLSHLIAVCKDGEQGYQSAQEDVDRADLRELFGSLSEQRGRFAAELWGVAHLPGDPADCKGTLKAKAHRGWMNLKAAVKKGDPKGVLRQVERGERAALKRYKEALQQTMPPDVHALVERQFGQIQKIHGSIAGLQREAPAV